jgi:hypothetical protein
VQQWTLDPTTYVGVKYRSGSGGVRAAVAPKTVPMTLKQLFGVSIDQVSSGQLHDWYTTNLGKLGYLANLGVGHEELQMRVGWLPRTAVELRHAKELDKLIRGFQFTMEHEVFLPHLDISLPVDLVLACDSTPGGDSARLGSRKARHGIVLGLRQGDSWVTLETLSSAATPRAVSAPARPNVRC